MSPTVWSRAALESRIAHLRVTFLREHTADIERFPSMVGIYWDFVRIGIIPTQEAFGNAVAVAMHRTGDRGVLARAYRTYPSLLRQHHFELVCAEHFPDAWHDEDMDHHGIDILVSNGRKVVGVAVAVRTDAVTYWERVKNVRNPPPMPVLHLYVNSEDAYFVGLSNVWLHPPAQVEEVAAFLEARS